MNLNERGNHQLPKYFAFLILLMLSALAYAQKPSKQSTPPAQSHSAPSKPSAPAHTAAPAHSNAPSHTSPGHTSPGNNTAAGHSTTGHSNTPGHTGNTTTGRTGTGTTGRGGNTAAGHTSPGHTATNATHAGAGAHPGAAAHGRTPPGRTVALKGGGSAHIRPNGQIRSVDRNGMHIERGIHGGRRVVSTRNGARVVTTGKRGGYVQRPYFSRGGRTYVQRTYVVNNVTYTGVYQSYGYGGYCCYYGYYPPYYYSPAYYGWAYNPWPGPVYYGWGWGGAPWYGYYGAYYEPYPVYPSAAFWLTDFVIAASLQAAYEAQENGLLYPDAANGILVASLGAVPAADSDAVKMSPDVKKALAEEIKAQLAAEQAEGGKTGSSGGQQAANSSAANSNEVPPALDPARRTFVVSSDLTLVENGEECALSEGDIITRTTDKPDDDRNVNVKVAASKKSDCAVGKEGPVSVDDLQEMHNHFRTQLTNGMGELAKKQGTGGLPKAPDTKTVPGDVPPPPPDKTAEKALQEQQSAADQTETEVKQEAGGNSGGGQQ